MQKMMKRYFLPLFAVMAIASVASCSEQIGTPENSGQPNLTKMTFSATMGESVESKTTYAGRNVFWEATDEITVFSVGESVTKTSFGEPELLENGAFARFSGLADATASTYYAVYPHSEGNTYADGTFSVTFPSTHTAVANGFPSGSNLSVAVSQKDADAAEQTAQFKNAGALLAFSFKELETALNTASVTFKVKKSDTEYYGISGSTTITLDENNLPVAAEGNEQEVVVNAPVGGFNTGVTYFIPVIPVGSFTGMEIVYTDLNGDEYEKKNDTDSELLRSYMFNVGQLPNPYPEIVLPDDFEVVLDFTKGWPFHSPYVSNHANGGETYYLIYNVGNRKKCLPIEINGPGGTETYYMKSTGLYFATNNNAQVYSPAIEDRYLTRILVNKTAKGRVNLNGKTSTSYSLTSVDYMIYSDKSIGTYNTGGTITHTDVKATVNTSYYIRARDEEVVMTKLTFTFSKTAPGNAPTAAAQ